MIMIRGLFIATLPISTCGIRAEGTSMSPEQMKSYERFCAANPPDPNDKFFQACSAGDLGAVVKMTPPQPPHGGGLPSGSHNPRRGGQPVISKCKLSTYVGVHANVFMQGASGRFTTTGSSRRV